MCADKDSGFDHDLPRNSQGMAILGDPRNDENVIVSQLHLAFLKFHNKAIDFVKADGVTPPAEVFARAQRLVRWHYQWIVVNEFLPHICGEDVVEDVLDLGRCFYNWRNEPFIPVEFAVGAYRFGHSQVRPGYRINDNFAAAIFGQPGDPNDLSGGRRLPVDRKMDWKNFFQTQAGFTPQLSKLMDTKLSSPLLQLPFIPPGNSNNPMSLAERNLLRSVDGDRMSYRRANPNWTPIFPGATSGDFTMADLLKFAGVA